MPAGVAGEEDGRLDVYLEPGEYLLRTSGPAGAKGEAALRGHRLSTRWSKRELQLPELREIEAELGDLEERSYWFELREAAEFLFRGGRPPPRRGRRSGATAAGWSTTRPRSAKSSRGRAGRCASTSWPPSSGPASTGSPWPAGRACPGPTTTAPIRWSSGAASSSPAKPGAAGRPSASSASSATCCRRAPPSCGSSCRPAACPPARAWRSTGPDFDAGRSFPESSGWLELTKESEPPYLEGYLDAERATAGGWSRSAAPPARPSSSSISTTSGCAPSTATAATGCRTLAGGDAADRLDANRGPDPPRARLDLDRGAAQGACRRRGAARTRRGAPPQGVDHRHQRAVLYVTEARRIRVHPCRRPP